MDPTQIEALVVRGIDYGDADRIIHLLTKQGRLEVFAHSARKSKRRFAGALEPFTSIRVTLQAGKKRTGMPTINSAQVQTARLGIRTDLYRIALASYVAELCSKVAIEGEACEPIYTLAEEVLDHLTEAPANLAGRRAFELRLMDVLGYRPQLDRCVVTQEVPEPPYLDLTRGGLVSASHRNGAPQVGPKTLEWMRAVMAASRFSPSAGLPEDHADIAARKLTGPVSVFYKSLLPSPLKSIALLEEMAL